MAKSWLNNLQEMDMTENVDIAALRKTLDKCEPKAFFALFVYELRQILDELEAARNFRMARGMAVTDYDSGDNVDFSHLPKGEVD